MSKPIADTNPDVNVTRNIDVFRDAIRRKFPARAEAAKTSAKASIRLFCIECMGVTPETLDCVL